MIAQPFGGRKYNTVKWYIGLVWNRERAWPRLDKVGDIERHLVNLGVVELCRNRG
jgi:hypothetical protein